MQSEKGEVVDIHGFGARKKNIVEAKALAEAHVQLKRMQVLWQMVLMETTMVGGGSTHVTLWIL